MSLVSEVFPSWISRFGEEGIPLVMEEEKPWSILSNSDWDIVSQIEELAGEDGVLIHPSAIVGDFVEIEGPCYIGPKAEIRHSAYLRSGSWICHGALVGHSSEIKNSILLPGSKAPHFNYVGDSILGSGVNLGAGSILSNVRNDGMEIYLRLGEGEKIPTGLRKLGALIGDSSRLGCNVVTNPGTIIPPSSMIPPNMTVSGYHSNS